ncbi:hypothetical protein [Actinoplanes sp. NPDC049265]|uniref:hypothetical protein n=1 Tax=Actinoplanes sp. NPDC049265 TaxID=3363902 RepID=UPI00371EE4D6
MTEPVPSATSPRRTVRVAVALVAGQAALCAVIGYLTIGGGPGPDAAGRGAEAQAPVIMPTASIGLPAAPLPPVPRKPAESRTEPQPPARRTHQPAAAVKKAATAKPSPRKSTAPPRPISAPDDGLAPAPPKPPNGLVPTGTPGNELTAPVKEGAECETEGQRGHTTDGAAMRCAKADDGALSWQPV